MHNTCNMGRRDLPDTYVCPQASGIHIRQIPPAHVTTYMYLPFYCTGMEKLSTKLFHEGTNFHPRQYKIGKG